MTSVLNQNQPLPPTGAPTAKRFSKPKLLLTTAILTVSLSLSSPEAWAAISGCTLSGTTTQPIVTCTSGGNLYSTAGITYGTQATDLTLIIQEGVEIETSSNGIKIDNNVTGNDVIIDIYSGVLITTTGSQTHGIYVDDAASVSIYSGADIETQGTNGRGIAVSDTAGSVSIVSTGDITTTASATNAYSHGIYVEGSGATYVKSTGNITTYGGRSRGIFVYSSSSAVIKSYGDITTKSASGGGSSAGIRVRTITTGDATVSLYGNITTEGTSPGIYVSDTAGKATINISGDITTGTDFVSSPSTSSNASGVHLRDIAGNAEVTLLSGGSITTYGGGAHGIYVDDVDGSANVVVDGDISTNGDASHAINVNNVSKDLSITVSGTVTANGESHGISVNSAQGPVNIQIDGSVMGGSDTGVGLRVGTLGSTEEREATITGSLGASSDIAIYDTDDSSTTNDGLTINNIGTITGIMNLNAGNDVLNNNAGGTWILRNGSSSATADFGSGTDSVVNAGTLRLASTGTGAKAHSLTNLESFSNSGTIDMSDDVLGDSLTISGTFTSNGGALRLDTVLDDGLPAQTDTLKLTSVQTSGGATKIYVNNVGGTGGQTTGNGILLVDVTTSSSNDAFTLGQAPIAGLYEYDLYFDATNYDWYLQSGLFDGVYEYPALVSGAMLAWQSDLDFLHNRLHVSRPAGPAPRIEPVAWTAGDSRKGGFWSNISGGRQKVKSGEPYEQHMTRLEAGLEGRFAMGSGAFTLGGFGGIGQNSQNFTGSTSEAEARALIAGAYASLGVGGYYGDVIAKYERHSADFSGAATADAKSPFDIDLYGLSVEAGHSLAMGPLSVQPYARMAYAKALAGSFEDQSGVEVDLEDGESLYGQLGTRFTVPTQYAEIYLNAGVKHQFLGEAEASVSGSTFTNDMPGTQGLIAAGLQTMSTEEQLLLSFETAYAKGADASELSGSVNMELKF